MKNKTNPNLPEDPHTPSPEQDADKPGDTSIIPGVGPASPAPANSLDRLAALRLRLAIQHDDALKELSSIWHTHPDPASFSRAVNGIVHDLENFSLTLVKAEANVAISQINQK